MNIEVAPHGAVGFSFGQSSHTPSFGTALKTHVFSAVSAAALAAPAVITALQSAGWVASRGQTQGPASGPSFIVTSLDASEGVSEIR